MKRKKRIGVWIVIHVMSANPDGVWYTQKAMRDYINSFDPDEQGGFVSYFMWIRTK